jgi:hypothetical protein
MRYVSTWKMRLSYSEKLILSSIFYFVITVFVIALIGGVVLLFINSLPYSAIVLAGIVFLILITSEY